ncbi:TonB family protein [bacterium]|nr:TonB family protein [bacterium]
MSRGLPISILLHILVLAALATWGGLTPMRPIDPQVLHVRLTPLPETLTEPEPTTPVEAEPEPEPSDPPEVQPEPVRREPDPVLPPKEVPEEAPETESEPEPEPEPRPLQPEPEPAEPEPTDPDPAAEVEPSSVAETTEPLVAETDEVFPFDYYLRTVRNNIARKWRPKQLGFRGDLERSCVVHFVIGRGGQVTGVTLVRSSGVSLFDREALRAVKSSRMPPLPSKFASPTLGVTFTFTLRSGV